MICPNCKVPMRTQPGSESGIMREDYYITEEIKVCPNPECNLYVLERYEAQEVPEKAIDLNQ